MVITVANGSVIPSNGFVGIIYRFNADLSPDSCGPFDDTLTITTLTGTTHNQKSIPWSILGYHKYHEHALAVGMLPQYDFANYLFASDSDNGCYPVAPPSYSDMAMQPVDQDVIIGTTPVPTYQLELITATCQGYTVTPTISVDGFGTLPTFVEFTIVGNEIVFRFPTSTELPQSVTVRVSYTIDVFPTQGGDITFLLTLKNAGGFTGAR